MVEEEGAGEVEVQELLPLLEGELIQRGGRARDDGAAAHGIDEDVDPAVSVDGASDGVLHGGGVERIRPHPQRPVPADLGDEPVERRLIHVDPTTAPPSRPMMHAVARPMPAPAPEISATLPWNLTMTGASRPSPRPPRDAGGRGPRSPFPPRRPVGGSAVVSRRDRPRPGCRWRSDRQRGAT